MATIKNQMKIKNGEGFDVLHNETSADVVKYSDTTVAGVLDGLDGKFVAKEDGKGLSSNDFTDELKSKVENLGTVLNYKGTVTDFDSIPSDTTVGDVWNISVAGGVDEHGVKIKAGDNVAKTATGFDVLGGSVDLTGYAKISVGNTAPTDTSVVWFDTSDYTE